MNKKLPSGYAHNGLMGQGNCKQMVWLHPACSCMLSCAVLCLQGLLAEGHPCKKRRGPAAYVTSDRSKAGCLVKYHVCSSVTANETRICILSAQLTEAPTAKALTR